MPIVQSNGPWNCTLNEVAAQNNCVIFYNGSLLIIALVSAVLLLALLLTVWFLCQPRKSDELSTHSELITTLQSEVGSRLDSLIYQLRLALEPCRPLPHIPFILDWLSPTYCIARFLPYKDTRFQHSWHYFVYNGDNFTRTEAAQRLSALLALHTQCFQDNKPCEEHICPIPQAPDEHKRLFL